MSTVRPGTLPLVVVVPTKMPGMLTGNGTSVTDTYATISLPSSPPNGTADWITAIVPVGAAALRCWPVGGRWDFSDRPLPLTNPDRSLYFGRRTARSSHPDALHRPLAALCRGEKALLNLDEVDRLATLLAPGPRRRDGLPAYWPAAVNEGQTLSWAMGKQRGGGLAARAILATVAVDLQGRDLADVSGSLLRLHDHERYTKDCAYVVDPRGARR